MKVLAIDPGYEQSAFVLFEAGHIFNHGILRNEAMREIIASGLAYVDRVVLEQIESFGMAVGREVFETVFWTGRFFEAASEICAPERMPRRTVKLHLCRSARAQDSNIRVALLDRFGGKDHAIGTKKA